MRKTRNKAVRGFSGFCLATCISKKPLGHSSCIFFKKWGHKTPPPYKHGFSMLKTERFKKGFFLGGDILPKLGGQVEGPGRKRGIRGKRGKHGMLVPCFPRVPCEFHVFVFCYPTF